mmetsp:Transcript_21306/g.66787  ORF Transcript_21306/g.66787 Transcript_21306/m.66787 type:complete len:223 (+) Transcript_21306:619-1287(+)
MTPQRGASARTRSSTPCCRHSRPSTWAASGDCASSQGASSAYASADSRKFLPPSCCGQSVPHVAGSSLRIAGLLPSRRGLSQSSSAAASTDASLKTSRTTTKPSSWNRARICASSPKATLRSTDGARDPGTPFRKLYKSSKAWDDPGEVTALSKWRFTSRSVRRPLRQSTERMTLAGSAIAPEVARPCVQDTFPCPRVDSRTRLPDSVSSSRHLRGCACMAS